jgi:hypothetical protein
MTALSESGPKLSAGAEYPVSGEQPTKPLFQATGLNAVSLHPQESPE